MEHRVHNPEEGSKETRQSMLKPYFASPTNVKWNSEFFAFWYGAQNLSCSVLEQGVSINVELRRLVGIWALRHMKYRVILPKLTSCVLRRWLIQQHMYSSVHVVLA